jgi:hypothetical protein
MRPLYAFLRYLSSRYSNNFVIEGDITGNNNVIRELNRFDPFCRVKFSLQIADPNRIINLIEVWAPRANAEVKQIYWRDLDNLITINCYSRSIEVTTRSHAFINECSDFANQLQYRITIIR